MYIKKITLNNFRIYRGENTLQFSSDQKKNLFVISGFNGYGKTTLLTSLVWCLYGKNMQEVDNIFKEKIQEAGGYKYFLSSCLNRDAFHQDEYEFSVKIVLADIEVPGVNCEEVEITRSFALNQSQDHLQITIDGFENELVNDSGKEFFIQDFILPREVAKFFFFDAERITSLAEIKSTQDKRQLSKAYTEILGIKKYEDLKNHLKGLRLRYRKESANENEREKLETLKKELDETRGLIDHKQKNIQELTEERNNLSKKSDDLQEKLIREGSNLTVEKIQDLRDEKERVVQEYEELKEQFKELLQLAPFAISSNLLGQIEKQLEIEEEQKNRTVNQYYFEQKKDAIIDDVEDQFYGAEEYISTFKSIIEKHLSANENKSNEQNDNNILHDFNKQERNQFQSLLAQLRESYPKRIKDVNRQIKINRSAFQKVVRQLKDAESKETDRLIQSYREEKKKADDRIAQIDQEITHLNRDIGNHENELQVKERTQNELSKKLKVSEKYEQKDKKAARLIQELDTYLAKVKEKKRKNLEQNIFEGLKQLMHKPDFINRVEVLVSNEIIDIELVDNNGAYISKENLSKGEQQLYATAILSALVKESQIQFPVFVDSPLQKFDDHHARQIITQFYPTISKQVVILPLLNKELSKEEYQQMVKWVKDAYLILNKNESHSEFINVNPTNLFEEAKEALENTAV